MVADELRRQADNFLELRDMAPLIARAQDSVAAAKIEIGCNDDDADRANDAGQLVSDDSANLA